MKTYIPMEKRSKKEQRAYYASKRGSWNGVRPVTQVIPNKKHYNRKKASKWKDELPLDALFLQKKANLSIRLCRFSSFAALKLPFSDKCRIPA